MTQLRPTMCALLLIITVSSTVLAGNIGSRTGNIASRTGNIASRTGNIASRTGNIPSRTGIIRSGYTGSVNAESRFGFSENFGRLIRLLLESGALF